MRSVFVSTTERHDICVKIEALIKVDVSKLPAKGHKSLIAIDAFSFGSFDLQMHFFAMDYHYDKGK